MAHELKMAIVESILQLRALHWSGRRIARHLGIDRGTVAKHLKRLESGPKPAISPAGSEGSKPATYPPAPGTVSGDGDRADSAGQVAESKPAIPPAGSPGSNGGFFQAVSAGDSGSSQPGTEGPAKLGRPSLCEPYRALILEKLERGLSAQRIYQDLVGDHGFAGGYDSVKRFVRWLGRGRVLPVRRMECAPGEEAQVDFGSGAPIVTVDGKRHKNHVFRIVLSHSRKGYSEATFRQTTEDFIGCLENAFWHFGGCPQVLVIDNLRAAVKHPDWFDPELVPKLRSFSQHYGIAILPTKPYMPRHKGKVESGVKYVQNNALKAKEFSSLPQENEHLAHWEATVADTRIHGTTRRHVGRVFLEIERPALRPLPRERFPFFHEAPRKVSRDGHVEVAKAYYSAPPEYLGHTIWARWDGRLVRIFNQRFEQIAVHPCQEKGRFSTHPQHLAPEKISGIERGAGYLLAKVHGIGTQTRQWAEAMLHARGIEGTRVLQGVLSLTRRHPCEALEKACEIALSHGAFHLRTIRQLIGRQADRQTTLSFLDEHPIIRPLADYAGVVAAALAHKGDSTVRFQGMGWTKECRGEESKKDPAGNDPRGPADILPPRSGYPLLGCSPAEPNSVSPDTSTVIGLPVFHHLKTENGPHE
jgi:transposase